ncbi:Uncharacterized protein conserved in bacteria [Citrobacter freundii]|nr:Uncharacterized protein conserved in bacteria [Citrobacter freundii]
MLKFFLSILTSRLLWGLLGTTIVAVVIWMIGPLLSIADTQPLKQEKSRIIFIMVVYLIWAQSYILPRMYNTWLNRKMAKNLKEETQVSITQQSQNIEERILTERFHDAMQMLKKAHYSKAGNSLTQWPPHPGTGYLYKLPWYMIIGAPGSGKTTVLANSGLLFPLTDRFGKTTLRGIDGTRNCDWWFTNNAVLLDTPGRYTIQESESSQDAREWLKFIGLLRKYRRHQPINGVVMTVSVSDLLTQPKGSLHQQAVNLRQRLSELHEQLGICFPVYVLIAKVDLFKGFHAWFANYDKTQRDQIWGFTFQWEQEKLPGFDLLSVFTREFALLQQRLEAGLAGTMLQQQDGEKRAEAWLFPQEFAALYPLLADYLNTVFVHSDFETDFSPRGIYFTSGTQDNLPFDRGTDELNHTLSLLQSDKKTASKDEPAPVVKGESYFIKDLLQNVIFQESGIAGRNWRWGLCIRAAYWSGYVLLAALMVTLGILLLTSYSKNKAYLQEVSAKVSQIEQLNAEFRTPGQHDLFAVLPLLNGLLDLPGSVDFEVDHPPVTRRMGLYRGYDVSNASLALYQKALQQRLLPDVAMYTDIWLRNDDGRDVEYSYEALKAYQMLFQPGHYDGKFLLSWIMLNLQRNLPQNITLVQLQQMEGHMFRLLVPKTQASPYTKDEALITKKRAFINQQPLSIRVYSRLKRLLEHDDDLKPVSLAALGGPLSELVFSRKSGTPVSEGIPGLYTPDGYWKVFNKQIDKVTSTLLNDDRWVLGASDAQGKKHTDNIVRQLYMRDFIANWDRFLADIKLNSSSDLSSRTDTARLLSARHSPLRRLIISMGQMLDLVHTAPEAIKGANHTEQGNRATRTLETLFGHEYGRLKQDVSITQAPELMVTEHYAQLIELAQPLEKGSKTIVFDNFIKQIDELYRYLVAVQDATNSGMPPPVDDTISRLQASAGRLPGELRTMFSQLAVGASHDTQRRDLDNVRKRINVEIGGFCQQAISGRYPLARDASSEVTPDDMSRMFAPGIGIIDTFYRDNLTTKVDTTQPSWRFMPGIDGKALTGSEGILRPFQQAQSIRDALFANGTTIPSFKVAVRTISMENRILNLILDVDGQQLRYSHGPQVTQMMSWPGPGGTNQVRMQFGLVDGSTSTIVTNGFWALNRFFDKAIITPGNSPLSRLATFNINGYQVTLEFVSNSIRNPFQLPRFSCP